MAPKSANGRLEPGQGHEEIAMVYRKYYIIGIWAEGVVYGGYVFLFIVAMNILWKRKDRGTFAANFYIGCMILMFIFISIHALTNSYRLVNAYVLRPAYVTPHMEETVNYLRNCVVFKDCYAVFASSTMLFWIADVLLIYRCWIVWARRTLVIVPSLILACCSISIGIFNMWWMKFPKVLPLGPSLSFLGLKYPIALSQNTLTTMLIAYRIWSQHRAMTKAGLHSATTHGRPNLLIVARIIFESAMIWTVQLLIITILYYIKDPADTIVNLIATPTMGIVFALVAVRTEIARARSAKPSSNVISSDFRPATGRSHFGIIPTWMGAESKHNEQEMQITVSTNRIQMDDFEAARHGNGNGIGAQTPVKGRMSLDSR